MLDQYDSLNDMVERIARPILIEHYLPGLRGDVRRNLLIFTIIMNSIELSYVDHGNGDLFTSHRTHVRKAIIGVMKQVGYRGDWNE